MMQKPPVAAFLRFHKGVFFPVACPGGIEIGVGAVGERMKTRTVHVDDVDGRDPLADVGVVFQPAKEHEHVAGLGPGRLEVPMAAGQRLPFRLADLIDVDFAVVVIRNPRATRSRLLGGSDDAGREGGGNATVSQSSLQERAAGNLFVVCAHGFTPSE